MKEVLRQCELFDGLAEAQLARLADIAERRTLDTGEYLFLLGDQADRLYVVLKGSLNVCFPLSFGGTIKDVAVETRRVGATLGWSALVKPFRFTLSARAAEHCEVASFGRKELQALLDSDPHIGMPVMGRVAEVVCRRLLTIQAMLARELQRSVSGGWADRERAASPAPDRAADSSSATKTGHA